MILALDLSVRRTGWCLGEAGGPVQTGSRAFSGHTIGEMLHGFSGWLGAFIDAERVQFLTFEQPVRPFQAANLDTLRKLYSLAGVAEMIATERNLIVRECKASVAKKVAYGNGKFSSKDKIAHGVRLIRQWPGFDPANHDESDACAVYIATLLNQFPDAFHALDRARVASGEQGRLV